MSLFDDIDTLDLRFKDRVFSIREFKEKHADVIAEFMASLRPREPERNIPTVPESKCQKLIRQVKEYTHRHISACTAVSAKIAASEKNAVPRPVIALILCITVCAVALLK